MSIHLSAQPGDIADVVLMPGDPLRARLIATKFLEDAVCYSEVRGMYGFTGTYKGRRVSVQGSGMGIPSISIYAHELLADYQVKTIMRVGTCGGMQNRVRVRDVILAASASTDSAVNRIRFGGHIDYAPTADFGLLQHAYEAAQKLGAPVHVGGVFTSDTFYSDNPGITEKLAAYGVLAVEMETTALYTLSAQFGAGALAILTVSDHLLTGEATTSAEREATFTQMMEIALETALHSSAAPNA